MRSQVLNFMLFFGVVVLSFIATTDVCFAVVSGTGVGAVAEQAMTSLKPIAKFITAASYLGGMAFAVAAVVKFKAHKDNPTQVHLSIAIVLLFVAAALLFIPGVFKAAGTTLFSGSAQGTISGTTTF